MKLAWICYRDGYTDDTGWTFKGSAEIRFTEPETYEFDRIVKIVYSEIEE